MKVENGHLHTLMYLITFVEVEAQITIQGRTPTQQHMDPLSLL